jgi:hypothetical protein
MITSHHHYPKWGRLVRQASALINLAALSSPSLNLLRIPNINTIDGTTENVATA